MWRRACPLLTVALAAGLVITRRRLSEAQAELDHLRALAKTPVAGAAAKPVAPKPESMGDGSATTGAVQTSENVEAILSRGGLRSCCGQRHTQQGPRTVLQ